MVIPQHFTLKYMWKALSLLKDVAHRVREGTQWTDYRHCTWKPKFNPQYHGYLFLSVRVTPKYLCGWVNITCL